MFYFKDGAWFLLKNDKLVAEVLTDNSLKYAQGMKAHYGEELEKYIVELASQNDAAQEITDTAVKINTDDATPDLSIDATLVDTLTDDQFPPFDPAFGVQTFGFMPFCVKNKITGDELTKLIRRCEAKLIKNRG